MFDYLWTFIILLSFLINESYCLEPEKLLLRGTIKENSRYYKRSMRSDPNTLHEIVIAIPQNNIDKLTELLEEVSNVNSPYYGAYLNYLEIGQLTSNMESTDLVLTWLDMNEVNVVSVTDHGEYITAVACIHIWERLFNTKFHQYEFVKQNHKRLDLHVEPLPLINRALSCFLPEKLNNHITSIFNLFTIPPVMFSTSNKEPINPGTGFSVGSVIDPIVHENAFLNKDVLNSGMYVYPEILQGMYNISGDGNGFGSQAVYEALGNTYAPSDLTYFQEYFNLTVQNVSNVFGILPNDNICHSNLTHEYVLSNCYAVVNNLFFLSFLIVYVWKLHWMCNICLLLVVQFQHQYFMTLLLEQIFFCGLLMSLI